MFYSTLSGFDCEPKSSKHKKGFKKVKSRFSVKNIPTPIVITEHRYKFGGLIHKLACLKAHTAASL